LTDRVERDAMAYIQRIDEMGGMIAAIERGFPQKEIADASYHYQRQVDRGEKSIVGGQRLRDGRGAPTGDPEDRRRRRDARSWRWRARGRARDEAQLRTRSPRWPRPPREART
jgi:methylmalonyl-CoA mutase N-terminal domain/subunit